MFPYIIILIVLCVIYILVYTPYPFVWLLRSHKDKIVEKGPKNIQEIKAGLIIKTSLPYQSQYPQSTFDVYYDPHQKVRAIVLWVHGGSFISGTSIGLRNFGPMLAKQGYLVCAMNYAYAPKYAFPTQIRQVDEMLCYLKGYIKDEYDLHTQEVFLGGDSAGAQIVASYASMLCDSDLARQSQVVISQPFHILGLLLFCGPYDFTEDIHREEFQKLKSFFKYIGWSYLGHKNWLKREEKVLASPLLHIHENYLPAYICDGKKYSFLWQGKRMVEQLKKHHVSVRYRFYEEMSHEFQFEYVKYPEESMQVYEDSLQFLQEIKTKEDHIC